MYQGTIDIAVYPVVPAHLEDILRREKKSIRAFNQVFSFTSMGVRLNEGIFRNGPSVFRICGELCHRIGHLLGRDGNARKFGSVSFLVAKSSVCFMLCQIYFSDEAMEYECRSSLLDGLRQDSIKEVQRILRRCNPYVGVYKGAYEVFKREKLANLCISINTDCTRMDVRRYNAPGSEDVAVIIPDGGTDEVVRLERDIVVRLQGGGLVRVDETWSCYEPLHYVLMFPFGTQGWGRGYKDSNGRKVTLMEYCQYRLAVRSLSFSVPHSYGRLFMQYVTDMWARLEQDRLRYFKTSGAQRKLRVELYQVSCVSVAAVMLNLCLRILGCSRRCWGK